MSYGITLTGFKRKTLATIKSELEADYRAAFGNQINVSPESVIGQEIAIAAERESEIWQLFEDAYNSQYRPTASGVSLENVGNLTTIQRLGAQASRIIEFALFGTLSTLIPAGTQFSVLGDSAKQFQSDSDVTLIAGTDEIQTITFSTTPTAGSFKLVHDGNETSLINWDDSNTEVQDALNALSSLSAVTVTGSFAAGFVVTFAGADGKQEQLLLTIADNTLTNGGAVTPSVTETTPGVYQGQVNCTALSTGPTEVAEKTLTVIDTPVAGLDSVFNPDIAVIGRNIETDPEYRIRQDNTLQISDAGPLEAIRTAILDLNDDATKTAIQSALVFENISNLDPDSRGIPRNAIEALVYLTGGLTDRDQEIAQAIFDSKAGGIEPHGDISKVVTDSQGFDHTVKFSRPSIVDIYLILDLTVTSDYPSDGDTQVKNLMVVWGNGLGVGQDVIVFPSLVAQLDTIPGITDVVVKIGIAPAPTLDNNIVIDDGETPGVTVELSNWETSNITVNS